VDAGSQTRHKSWNQQLIVALSATDIVEPDDSSWSPYPWIWVANRVATYAVQQLKWLLRSVPLSPTTTISPLGYSIETDPGNINDAPWKSFPYLVSMHSSTVNDDSRLIGYSHESTAAVSIFVVDRQVQRLHQVIGSAAIAGEAQEGIFKRQFLNGIRV
jgi:hypothetical protein